MGHATLKKTRIFAQITLLVGMVFAMLGCQRSCRSSVFKRDDLGLIPKEATWVARWDVRRWMASPTGKHMYDLVERRDFVSQRVQTWMTRLGKDCGLDPVKRIHTMLAAFPAALAGEPQPQPGESYFFVLRGQFAEQDIVSCAEKLQKTPKLLQKSVSGVTVYHLDATGRLRFALPLGKDVLLVGSEKYLDKVLSGKLQDQDTLLARPALRVPVAALMESGDAFWLVGLSTGNTDVQNSMARFLKKIADVELVRTEISFQKGLAITLGVRMVSPVDAAEVETVLRGKLEQFLVNQPRIRQSKLGEVIKNAQISLDGAGVSIRLTADPVDADPILDLVNGLVGGPSSSS